MAGHQITTRAGPGVCPVASCAAPVVEGFSEGLRARCDIYALTPDQEFAAILAGRETYSLTEDRRLVRRLGNSTVPGPVLIAHRCGFGFDPPPSPARPTAPEAFVPPF